MVETLVRRDWKLPRVKVVLRVFVLFIMLIRWSSEIFFHCFQIFFLFQIFSKGQVWHKQCFKCSRCSRFLDSRIACDAPDDKIYCNGPATYFTT